MASSQSLFERGEGGVDLHEGLYLQRSAEWLHPYEKQSTTSSGDVKPSLDVPKQVLGDNAAWRLYNKAAKEVDERLVKDWNSKLGGILLFAALFAAVVTTLLVNTMTLLEPSPLERTEKLLYFLATQSVNRVTRIPTELDINYTGYVFIRPHWAFVINGLLVASLSFSVLVALGAVVCLEWVNEYEAYSRAISTPENQALRRHYRFRAIRKWHMSHLIGALPFMMFLVVMLFFVALVMWLWRVDRFLALVPILGACITGAAHLFTTTLAVIYPSAPFKTSLSEAVFRILTYLKVLFWFVVMAFPIWFKFMLERLDAAINKRPTDAASRSYTMSWAKTMHDWNDRVHGVYPWLPRSLHLKDAIRMGRREDHAVKNDGTLQLSALAWLSSSLDLTPDSYEGLIDIFRQINTLEVSQLQGWGPFEYEAPWNDMFRVLLAQASTQRGGGDEPAEMETILADLLQKMLVNQPLFSRVVRTVNQPSLIAVFVEALAKAPPIGDAKDRLRGMATVLSSLDAGGLHRTEWPLRHIFKVLCDNMQTRGQRIDAYFTSWIFPLCGHNAACDGHEPQWEDASQINFAHPFGHRNCRIDTIVRFMKLIDVLQQDVKTTPEDTQVMFALLIDHILTIHLELEANNNLPIVRPQSLAPGTFTDPALELISCTLGGRRVDVIWPPESPSPQWEYAVKHWCRWKRQAGSRFSSGEVDAEVSFLSNIWQQSDESVFVESVRMLDRRASILAPRDWTRIFDNLSQVAPLTCAKSTRILALFEQTLQPLEGEPSLGGFLKIHIHGRSGSIQPVEYNPLIASTPQAITSPARKRWSGSSHRYPPRYSTAGPSLNELSEHSSSLLKFVSQSLGSYRQEDPEQTLLRVACAGIIHGVIQVVPHFESTEISLLADFQDHLEESDPLHGDTIVQACISEIRSKLENGAYSRHLAPIRRPSSRGSGGGVKGKARERDAEHTLSMVPEAFNDVIRSASGSQSLTLSPPTPTTTQRSSLPGLPTLSASNYESGSEGRKGGDTNPFTEAPRD